MKGTEGKYAWTAKVGEKGQIVIPKEARDIFGISPGDTVSPLGDSDTGQAIGNTDIFTQFANSVLKAQKESDGEKDVCD